MKQKLALLEIKNLSKTFEKKGSISSKNELVMALNGVSFQVFERECLAIIGETGSGKSTLAKCLLRFTEPTSGEIFYQDLNLLDLSEGDFQKYRRKCQMIFQEPLLALNPRLTVASALHESLRFGDSFIKKEADEQATALLEMVGLQPDVLDKKPGQLSGGQRQRVTIARALSVSPELLIADEPTSSLDAEHKLKVIMLLEEMQQKLRLTLVLISHDLSIVAGIADRIAVMFKGEVVELGSREQVLEAPKHPYTTLLLKSAFFDFDDCVKEIEGAAEAGL